MRLELFIYWRAAPADAAAARSAALQWQAELRARHPGLTARLYERAEGGAAQVTLMEAYSHGAGIGPALQAQIVDEGRRALAPWCQGARHVEVFVPVSD